MKQYLFTIILTAAITFALTWAVWKLSLRFKLYPAIRDRDVHTTPSHDWAASRSSSPSPRRLASPR